MVDGSEVDVASGHLSPTESKADSVVATQEARRDSGGGCATRCGIARAMETKRGSAGCAQCANPIISISAIVASNPGDIG